MYSGLQITPPFFELGPKAYTFGTELLEIARRADELSARYDVQVILTPQYVDIPIVAREMRRVLVFAQHMDWLEPGRGSARSCPRRSRRPEPWACC